LKKDKETSCLFMGNLAPSFQQILKLEIIAW
jgi:hypothetical protein